MKLTNLFWGNTQGITLGVKIQKSQNSVKKRGGWKARNVHEFFLRER